MGTKEKFSKSENTSKQIANMNYQKCLLSKNQRFGSIWLAAHHSSKLSKAEVIKLNLSKKCKEIEEFILQGPSNNKPRFSLLISSHLMLGMVVILNRKNTYLQNDVNNLNTQIHTSYMQVSYDHYQLTSISSNRSPTKRAQ